MKMQLSKYTVEVASKIPFFLFFCYCVGNYLLAQQMFANEGKKKKKIIGLQAFFLAINCKGSSTTYIGYFSG